MLLTMLTLTTITTIMIAINVLIRIVIATEMINLSFLYMNLLSAVSDAHLDVKDKTFGGQFQIFVKIR